MSDLEDRIARLEAALGLDPEIKPSATLFMFEIEKFVRRPLQEELREIQRQLRTVSPDYFNVLVEDLENKIRTVEAFFDRRSTKRRPTYCYGILYEGWKNHHRSTPSSIIKIGESCNPEARVRSLIAELPSPETASCMGWYPGRDKDAHRKFSDFWLGEMRGLPGKTEWFHAAPKIIEHFAQHAREGRA